jgi:hypothetical protein
MMGLKKRSKDKKSKIKTKKNKKQKTEARSNQERTSKAQLAGLAKIVSMARSTRPLY